MFVGAEDARSRTTQMFKYTEDQHEQHQKNRKSNSKVCEKRTEQAKSLEDRVTHGLKRTNESSFSAHK